MTELEPPISIPNVDPATIAGLLAMPDIRGVLDSTAASLDARRDTHRTPTDGQALYREHVVTPEAILTRRFTGRH